MKRFALLLVFVSHCCVAAPFVCAPSAKLSELAGYYARADIPDAASRLRSWPAILKDRDADSAGLIIRDGKVFLSRSWHEGDTGDHCVRTDAKGVWVREAGRETKVWGPYRRIAGLGDDEALAYLAFFMKGCYEGSDASRWCFSKHAVTVDGIPFEGKFQLDTSELPEYGTSFRVLHSKLPLLVFAPLPSGWAAYADDYVSAEGRVPVVPGRTKPLFTLAPEASMSGAVPRMK